MTKSKAIANHRRMWTWIANSIKAKKKGVWKSQFFNYISEKPLNNCYCCEYASKKSIRKMCKKCPLIWGNSQKGRCMDNEYKKWLKAMCKDNWQEAERYARIIANLPERK